MLESKVTRRGSLVRFGGLVGGLLGAAGWKIAESEGAGPAAVASGAVSCVLTPEQTEGPYYLANEKLRRDITEGRPGVPLLLRLRVVDASTCKPIKGAAVDVWHADAVGVYSGFGSGSGSRTFMRGIQRTDANGLARFRSVYPGWYQGRAHPREGARRRQRRPHRAAVLPGLAHRPGVPPQAVQPPWQADDAQRERLGLRERWQALDAEPAQERRRLRRRHHDGRPPLVAVRYSRSARRSESQPRTKSPSGTSTTRLRIESGTNTHVSASLPWPGSFRSCGVAL